MNIFVDKKDAKYSRVVKPWFVDGAPQPIGAWTV